MINAGKHALREFDGRNLLCANRFRCLQGRGEVELVRGGRNSSPGISISWRGRRSLRPGKVGFRGGNLRRNIRQGQCGCCNSQRHGGKKVASIHLRNGKGEVELAQLRGVCSSRKQRGAAVNESNNFLLHMHPVDGCDGIVCWIHNLAECPLEVIELKKVVRRLRRRRIARITKSAKN